jgi:hypothetical protein
MADKLKTIAFAMFGTPLALQEAKDGSDIENIIT